MTEHSISVTLKAGTGYDAPWVVIYGDSPDEVEAKLTNADTLLSAAVTAAATLRTLHATETGGLQVAAVSSEPAAPAAQQPAGWGNSAPAAAPGWSGAQQAAPAPQSGPTNGTPHPTGQQCQACGQVVQYKQITAKASGKTFTMWTCPNQRSKGDGHHSEFIN